MQKHLLFDLKELLLDVNYLLNCVIMLLNIFFSFFIITILPSNLVISTSDSDDGVFEQVLSNINDILKENELSNEERHRKIAQETKKLSKSIDDIELSKEEIEKLSTVISKWNEDLKKRIEDLHSKDGDLTHENIMKLIDESIASRPELTKEVGNVLRSKDQGKVKRFFSKLQSVTERLGHKIAEKFRSGWKMAKKLFKKTQKALIRTVHVGLGLFEFFILNPLIIIGTYLFDDDDDDYSDLMAKALYKSSVMRIYDAIFKFHGDADYEKKILAHNEAILKPVTDY